MLRELQYLAIASTSKESTGTKEITKLWSIEAISLQQRSDISVEQAGRSSDSIEDYYLFELGKPITLQAPIQKVPHRPIEHTMKLTTLAQMFKIDRFSELEVVYPQALKK